jgi:hypothetical protein
MQAGKLSGGNVAGRESARSSGRGIASTASARDDDDESDVHKRQKVEVDPGFDPAVEFDYSLQGAPQEIAAPQQIVAQTAANVPRFERARQKAERVNASLIAKIAKLENHKRV